MTDFNALFKRAIESGASDIHLQAGRKLVVRVNGTLLRVGDEPIAAALSHRGLTSVTGTTGSGKCTTLAAMIELINDTVESATRVAAGPE